MTGIFNLSSLLDSTALGKHAVVRRRQPCVSISGNRIISFSHSSHLFFPLSKSQSVFWKQNTECLCDSWLYCVLQLTSPYKPETSVWKKARHSGSTCCPTGRLDQNHQRGRTDITELLLTNSTLSFLINIFNNLLSVFPSCFSALLICTLMNVFMTTGNSHFFLGSFR